MPDDRITILFVDDDARLRSLVPEMLDLAGYRVLVAPDGAAAEQVCRRHKGPIHLLLMDIMMPGRSGEEVAFRLASIRPDARLLYVSGLPQEQLANRDSHTMFLAKPFGMDALINAVAEALTGHSSPPDAENSLPARDS